MLIGNNISLEVGVRHVVLPPDPVSDRPFLQRPDGESGGWPGVSLWP